MSAPRSAVCVVVAVLVWLPAAAVAELRVAVEPRVIDELETTRLTIRASGSNQTRRLDLEALEEDFEVLTTQSASQYRAVNGRVQSWVEYQILLRPRRPGELTIPPIRVDGETTEPLILRVRGIDPELRQAIDRMVFFESELTADPVYVQSQTVLVRRLFYSSGAQIYSDLPGIPEIPDAIVMPLGETTSSTTIRDGRRYGVIEQRFALFPERSGELVIPAISVTSSVRLESGGRTRRTGVSVATEPMIVNVLPIPAEYPADRPWLPAEDLVIADRWDPVDARLEVGDPVTRTLTARVEGNVSSAIPPLEPALPEAHFRRYPEPPDLEDRTGSAAIRGVREQTYAIIPTAPGSVTLPSTEVVWWDVTEHRVRTARAPGRTLRITGAPAASPAGPAEPAGREEVTATRPEPAIPVDVDVRSDQVPWPGAERRRIMGWTVLSLLAVVAGLMLLQRYWNRHAARAGHPPSRRACWRMLKKACARGDTDTIHQALLHYLRAHYGAPLAESIRRFREDGHGGLLDALNADLYRPGADTVVRGRQVLEAVRDLRRGHRRTVDPLPALYD